VQLVRAELKEQAAEPHLAANRALVAQWFLRGDGIEIGALHHPLPMPPLARVKYVDRMPAEGLRAQYPELKDLPLVDPDIVDNGEMLSTVAAESRDFIVASHFLEHCQNPVATLQTFARVLRPDGILLLVIPDKLYTFDKDRPSTTPEHIVRDFEEGPHGSREQHYREYARLVDHAAAGEAEELRARYLMDMDYSIHFHVWTKPELLGLFAFVNERYRLGYELRFFLDNGPEGIYVLRKSAEFGLPVRIIDYAGGTQPPDPPGAVPPEDPVAPKTGRQAFWSRIRKPRSPG
jgi:predicted SAM-dependent methyltransferase